MLKMLSYGMLCFRNIVSVIGYDTDCIKGYGRGHRLCCRLCLVYYP